MKTISEANCSENWRKKSTRHKKQKMIVHGYLCSQRHLLKLPAQITLTRISQRNLDEDNLVSAFKWILDAVCEEITPGLAPGRADGVKGLSVKYKQKKSEDKNHYVQIEIAC